MNSSITIVLYKDLETLKRRNENIDIDNLVNHIVELLEENNKILNENESLKNTINYYSSKKKDLEIKLQNEIHIRREKEQVIFEVLNN